MKELAVTIIVAASLAIAAGGAAYGLNGHRAAQAAQYKLAEAESRLALAQRQVAAEQAAGAVTQKQLTALKAQKGKTDAALQTALTSNQAWSDGRVPDAVRDAIRVRHATD